MADKKPLPKFAKQGSQPQAGFKKSEPPLTEEPMSDIDVVRLNAKRIFMRFAEGETLAEIGKSITPVPLTAMQIRAAISHDRELKIRMNAIEEERSHALIDEAISAAMSAKRGGEYKTAIAGLVKLAEKTAPHIYGPRVQVKHVGYDDGPVEHKVESTVHMTADEAYRAMLGGA